MVTKEQKEQIIAEYGRTAGDTGSPEVQIAILTAWTEKINQLCLETFILWTSLFL